MQWDSRPSHSSDRYILESYFQTELLPAQFCGSVVYKQCCRNLIYDMNESKCLCLLINDADATCKKCNVEEIKIS